MAKQKIKITKKDIFEEKKDSDIWWQDSRRNAKKTIIATAIFILFVAAIGSAAYLFDQQNKINQKKLSALQQELDEAKKNMQADKDILQSKLDDAQKKLDEAEKEKLEKANQKITLEGSLSYPGSSIPEDMAICAQDLANADNLVCTKNHITDKKYKYGVGYKLEVAPGSYNVYASVSAWQGYKAYYDEFVTCGMKYGCASHEPIKITAESGKNLSDIDPIDWYKQ